MAPSDGDDDVEGHSRHSVVETDDDDDVEGHSRHF
jgi:hypothetical protein